MTLTARLERYRALKDAIAAAARAAGRDPAEVDLLAVSKTHPAEPVAELLAAGHRHFGENRVQEAAGKYPALREAYPDLRLHLIGPLQTNKVREAVALFDVIETLDRPKLAKALAAEMDRTGRRIPCLIEVNIGAEPQKAGIAPDEAAGFLAACRGEWRLDIAGLMCIPPAGEDPVPHFRHLKTLADALGLAHLSMGMSGDYREAVACGAGEIRVGTALFGSRAQNIDT
jgi:pyridoxal phosphate enzyme (YggS family)